MSPMAPEPYDYHNERRVAGFVLVFLITFLVGYDALSEFTVDPVVLAQLVGALLAVLGLGALLRRRQDG